jgi:hypothetical protein
LMHTYLLSHLRLFLYHQLFRPFLSDTDDPRGPLEALWRQDAIQLHCCHLTRNHTNSTELVHRWVCWCFWNSFPFLPLKLFHQSHSLSVSLSLSPYTHLPIHPPLFSSL